MSFRKKNREAEAEGEGEGVKVVHEQNSKQDKSQEQSSAQPDQQSGQETGQPPAQSEEQTPEEQTPEEQTSEEQPAADDEDDKADDTEPVPDGTTAEILRWVGDDKGRAVRALEKERTDDRPRAGLTGELNKLLSS